MDREEFFRLKVRCRLSSRLFLVPIVAYCCPQKVQAAKGKRAAAAEAEKAAKENDSTDSHADGEDGGQDLISTKDADVIFVRSFDVSESSMLILLVTVSYFTFLDRRAVGCVLCTGILCLFELHEVSSMPGHLAVSTKSTTDTTECTPLLSYKSTN